MMDKDSDSKRKQLSERYLIAIREYMKGRSQGEAMRIAGFSPITANDHPEYVFGRSDVQAEIQRRRDEVERKASISVEWIIENIKTIVEAEDVSHANKLRALELLAKHLGMLTDKVSLNIEDDIVRRIQAGRDRIAAVKAELEEAEGAEASHLDGDNPVH